MKPTREILQLAEERGDYNNVRPIGKNPISVWYYETDMESFKLKFENKEGTEILFAEDLNEEQIANLEMTKIKPFIAINCCENTATIRGETFIILIDNSGMYALFPLDADLSFETKRALKGGVFALTEEMKFRAVKHGVLVEDFSKIREHF
jgi:hypothetical protein